jgi:hypothetical protein
MNQDQQPDLPGVGDSSMPPAELAAINRLRERRDFKPVKCECCDKEMGYDEYHNSASTGDEGTTYEGKTLCESCYSEDQPETTLRIFDAEHPDGEGEYGDTVFEVGSTRNATADNGDIGLWRTHRERIDGWRSYVKVDPPKDWVEFHGDTSLSGSADERELKRFDLYLRKALIARGVRLVRACSITTNVFSNSVDYFVEREHAAAAKKIAEKLAKAFRDPVKFNLTAITGKDPEDASFGDHLLAAIGANILRRKP